MYDIENYYERMKALLASQFQASLPDGTKTNLQKFIYAIAQQLQTINTVELQLFNQRWLSTAVGVQLDGIGSILGLARLPGQSDSDYREALQFQVFINRSTGTPEEAIATLKFLTKATRIKYWEGYPAFYQMFTNGLIENFSVPPDDVVTAIHSISPIGVQYVPITCSFGAVPTFVFTGDPIVEGFYVAPNPADLSQINPFHVSTDGIDDLQFQINRGQVLTDPDGGWFAEDNFEVEGAGFFCEVLVINGSQPLP